MLFERDTWQEWQRFLHAREGKKRFVDVGASGGFFSAIFAQTASGPDEAVLSIELDPPSFAVLQEVREVNAGECCRWFVDPRGVSDAPGRLMLEQSGYGAALRPNGQGRSMEVDTLEAICRAHAMEPDLLKVDIEGMEYELFMGSEDFLRHYRPTIHLELHPALIAARDKDPSDILAVLGRLGYHDTFSGKPIGDWRRMVERERLHLYLSCQR